MNCSEKCAKQYYQDWRSVGYNYTLIVPELQGDRLIFTFPFPFFFITIATTYNVPASGSPNYPNAGILAVGGPDNNTYYPLLQAMFIAMAYANRDYDNPDGITEYEAGDWPGYFKNYLNEKLQPTNFYTFMSFVSRYETIAQLRAAVGFTPESQTNFYWNDIWQQTFPGINKKFFGAPGTYSFLYQDLAPVTTFYNPFNNNCNGGCGVNVLTYRSGFFPDLSAIPVDINLYTSAYIRIVNGCNFTTAYGSLTVPYANAPNWAAFPGDPQAAIFSWIITAITAITGTPAGDFNNVFLGLDNTFGGINPVTLPYDSCINQYTGRIGVLFAEGYTWGTLAFSATTNYILQIAFSKSESPDPIAPYSELLYQFGQAFGGVENLKLLTIQLKPIE